MNQRSYICFSLLVLLILCRSSIDVTSAAAAATATRIACVGDSITAYACASNASMTYPAQLQRRLGNNKESEDFTVLNFGASGHTMLRKGLCGNGARHDQPVPVCGGDCSYWNSTAFDKALASQPDIVLIMMGTNDAKYCNWYGPPNKESENRNDTAHNGAGAPWAFVTDYHDMIRRFQSLPTSPSVYVVLPPPLTHPPINTTWPAPFNMSLNVINSVFPWLQRKIAYDSSSSSSGAAAVRVLDVWGALGGSTMDPNLTCDGCHPKDEALGIIAETIALEILGETPDSSLTE